MKPIRLAAARELALSQTVQNLALLSGMASSVFYVIMCIIAAAAYPGYSSFSQTVSELSAIGAPTVSLWNKLRLVYALLAMFSAWGFWIGSADNQPLRTAGIAMFVYAFATLFWPPMHPREILAAGGSGLTDTLHITFTFVAVILMMSVMILAAPAFGKAFRLYTLISIGIMVIFGLLTSTMTTAMQENRPTPWMGVGERICIGSYLAWVIILSLKTLSQKTSDLR